jgi:hypothetical protein
MDFSKLYRNIPHEPKVGCRYSIGCKLAKFRLTRQGNPMFAIPFFQTVLSLLFIGIWFLVGQIISTDR